MEVNGDNAGLTVNVGGTPVVLPDLKTKHRLRHGRSFLPVLGGRLHVRDLRRHRRIQDQPGPGRRRDHELPRPQRDGLRLALRRGRRPPGPFAPVDRGAHHLPLRGFGVEALTPLRERRGRFPLLRKSRGQGREATRRKGSAPAAVPTLPVPGAWHSLCIFRRQRLCTVPPHFPTAPTAGSPERPGHKTSAFSRVPPEKAVRPIRPAKAGRRPSISIESRGQAEARSGPAPAPAVRPAPAAVQKRADYFAFSSSTSGRRVDSFFEESERQLRARTTPRIASRRFWMKSAREPGVDALTFRR